MTAARYQFVTQSPQSRPVEDYAIHPRNLGEICGKQLGRRSIGAVRLLADRHHGLRLATIRVRSRAVQLPVVGAAQWHCELIADFQSHRLGLGEA